MNGTEMSFLSVIGKMGLTGQSIAILIFILSIIAIFVFVDRLIALKMKRGDELILAKVNEAISIGNIESAKNVCQNNGSPLSRVLYKGISRIGMPLKDIEASMDKAIDLEVFKMEKGEEILGLISKLAPMLGFIGTIAGVIQIFYTINATGDYNIESISGGLYVKMLTSALGLTLGIFAYFFYFVVSRKIKKNIFILEQGSSEFIDSITSPLK
ncbi:MAG: MotA/TolQ/ExbB proton channel family protein [Chitinophagales bacterium]